MLTGLSTAARTRSRYAAEFGDRQVTAQHGFVADEHTDDVGLGRGDPDGVIDLVLVALECACRATCRAPP